MQGRVFSVPKWSCRAFPREYFDISVVECVPRVCGPLCKPIFFFFFFFYLILLIISLSHSTYNFGRGRFVRDCRSVPFRRSTERFLAPPPRVLFHRPFKGGVSVVVPHCCRQKLFNDDPSLISACFVLGSAWVLLAFVWRSTCFVFGAV